MEAVASEWKRLMVCGIPMGRPEPRPSDCFALFSCGHPTDSAPMLGRRAVFFAPQNERPSQSPLSSQLM